MTLERNARITAPGGQVTLRGVSGRSQVRSSSPRSPHRCRGTTDSVLPMAANVGEIELRGNELADFPLQRDGVLRGKKVTFDLRELRFVENTPTTADDDQYFLPIGNVTAAVTSVRRTIGERLVYGGTVTIEGDRVELAAGSLIDFSGGQVRYEPGFLQTSLLVSQGRVFDINRADPNLVYDAVLPYIDVDYTRWGVTDRFNVFGLAHGPGRFEAGYTVGYDAGSLSIRALELTLDGRLRGVATPGRLQRDPPGTVLAGRQRFANELPLAGLFDLGTIALGTGLPVGPDGIRLGARQPGDDDLALAIPDQLFNEGGINRVRVISGGALRLGDFTLAPGGELSARGSGDSLIDGRVVVPAGTVEVDILQPPALRPSLTMTAAARIDVRGLWVNDLPALNPNGPRRSICMAAVWRSVRPATSRSKPAASSTSAGRRASARPASSMRPCRQHPPGEPAGRGGNERHRAYDRRRTARLRPRHGGAVELRAGASTSPPCRSLRRRDACNWAPLSSPAVASRTTRCTRRAPSMPPPTCSSTLRRTRESRSRRRASSSAAISPPRRAGRTSRNSPRSHYSRSRPGRQRI